MENKMGEKSFLLKNIDIIKKNDIKTNKKWNYRDGFMYLNDS